jgi:hypothetical protein
LIAARKEERVLRSGHGKANERRRMKKKEGCKDKDKEYSLLHDKSARRKKKKKKRKKKKEGCKLEDKDIAFCIAKNV